MYVQHRKKFISKKSIKSEKWSVVTRQCRFCRELFSDKENVKLFNIWMN